MGLGGMLTWSAAFREMRNEWKRWILPIEVHGQVVKIIDNEIFDYNKDVAIDYVGFPDKLSLINLSEELKKFPYVQAVALNHPETNYCKCDTPTYARHRTDTHIIQQILEFYKIKRELKDLKPYIHLRDDEQSLVDELCRSLPAKFVTIEPISNTEYTINREYPIEHWQHVVDSLSKDVCVVQVGTPTGHKLKNVVHLNGKTTFRTCAGVIGRSSAFLSTEGGLVHAARAFDTRSVCVITGYQHPDMVAYPLNTNLWIHGNHGPCGIKRPRCRDCEMWVNKHDPLEIIDATKSILEKVL